MNKIETKEDLISYLEEFNFELELSKWEDENKAVNPTPFMRFKWMGFPSVEGGAFLLVYKEDGLYSVHKRLRECLIDIGKRAKEYEIKKRLFDND